MNSSLNSKNNTNISPFPLLDDLDGHFHTIVDILKSNNAQDSYAIAFSSCSQGEGTSTVALNFATAISKFSESKILLIDGNLRNGGISQAIGKNTKKGILELIKGKVTLNEVVIPILEHNFTFIPAGSLPHKPEVAYETEDFSKVLDKLKEHFKFIIFDSSPIMNFAETVIQSSKLDGIVLIIEASKTRWEVAKAAKENLTRAKANILGAILNKKKYYIPKTIYNLL